MLIHEPSPGTDISRAISQATEMARDRQEPVACVFNGNRITVSPGDSASDVLAKWSHERDAEAKAYRESPQGRKDAEAQAQEIRSCQRRIDAASQSLSGDIDMTGVIAALRIIAQSHRTGVQVRTDRIVEALRAKGYVQDEYVGHEPRSDFETNPTILGRWIVGQAIDGLQHYGCMPEVIIGFAERYERMVKP